MRRELGGTALLAVLALLRFSPALRFGAPLGDELAYDRGFALAAAGESPYAEPGFLYPPLFARLGGWLRALGPLVPLALLRTLNLLAAAWLVWRSTAWLGWSWRWRWLAGAAVLLLSPALAQGIVLGNVSFLVGALIVGALLFWPRRPAVSGALFAASLAIKPLAPAAIVALGLHRPRAGGRRQLLAAAWAGGLASLALVATPGLGEFLARTHATSVLESTVSPYRFVVLAGAGVPPLAWLLVTLALLAWGIRRASLDRDALLACAVVAAIVATPLVWNHTLLLTLPLQAMVVHRLLERRRAGAGGRPLELALVALGVAALHLAEGATGITDRGAALQLVAALPPALAPPLLLAYLLRTAPPVSGDR